MTKSTIVFLIEATPVAPHRVRKNTGHAIPSDLAKLVGVTKVMASRALNTPELVSGDAFEHVREAVRQIGYTPDFVAGSLVSNRGRLIVALIPTAAGSVLQETAATLTTELTAAGYQLSIGQSGYDESREDALPDAIVGWRLVGIALIGVVHFASVRQKLQAAGVPVVETRDITHNLLDMLVGLSHQKVDQAATRYLKQRGAKRPAVIIPSDRRTQVHVQASVKAFDLEAYIPVMAAESLASLGDGRRALGTLLEQYPDTDATFCGTNIFAFGMPMEAEHRGIAAPAQLRVVGHGNQVFAKDTMLALTIIRIDGTGIGKLATTLLINCTEHGDEERCTVDVGFTLVEYDNV